MSDPAASAPLSDRRVELGHAIFALVEPHRGHELAWNRWYERDHLIAAGGCAPWTIATQRWIATRREKALRYPARNPICEPVSRGSFLAAIWIQSGRYDDQQRWVAEQVAVLAANGRNFDQRDVLTTAGYDYLGGALRDADGVPPELALDRRYPGVVLVWTERRPETSLDALRAWLTRDLPARRDREVADRDGALLHAQAEGRVVAEGRARGAGSRRADLDRVFHRGGSGGVLRAAVRGSRGRDRRGRSRAHAAVAPFAPLVPGVDPPVASSSSDANRTPTS